MPHPLRYKRIFSTLLLSLLLVGCGVRRVTPPKGASDVVVDDPSSSVNLFLNQKPVAKPYRLNGTATISRSGDPSLSSSMYISVVPEEGIVIAVRPLPFVEIGRLYLLRDAVVAVDKLDKYYVRTDYKTLSGQLNLELSYPLLESMLLGYLSSDAVELKVISNQQLRATPLGREYAILYNLFSIPPRPAKSTLTSPAYPSYALILDYKGYYDSVQGATPKALTAKLTCPQQNSYQLDVSLSAPAFREDAREQIVPSIGDDYKRVELTWLFDKLLQL